MNNQTISATDHETCVTCNLIAVIAAVGFTTTAKTTSSLYTFSFCSSDGIDTFDTRSRSYSEALDSLILFCGSESEAAGWIYIRPYAPNRAAI